jgi:hypothetical protein
MGTGINTFNTDTKLVISYLLPRKILNVFRKEN